MHPTRPEAPLFSVQAAYGRRSDTLLDLSDSVGGNVKHIEPEHATKEVGGAFQLDRAFIERLIQAAKRHIEPAAAKVSYALEFESGRKVVSDNVEDLDQFPFHNPRKGRFQVTIAGSQHQSIDYTFRFDRFSSRATVWVWRANNTSRAIEDAVEAVKSGRTWYGALNPMLAFFVGIVPVGPIATYLNSAMEKNGGAVPLIGYILIGIYLAWIVVAAARFLIWPNTAVMFGISGQKVRARVSIARWVLTVIGALIIAVIGGGYLRSQ